MRTWLFPRGNSPFALTPDPRFAFPSSSYESALETLQRRLEQQAGVMLLTGPAGCGKTMLLRALQDRIARDGGLAFFRAFFPFNPNLHFDSDAAVDDLLSSLLTELRHESIMPSRAEREQAVGRYIEQLPRGAHAVLLLDDAHRFDDSDRDVMLLPQRWRGGLQVILAGRAGLVERYRQFVQANDFDACAEAARNPVVVELGPLTPSELATYVAHRLAVARIRRADAAFSPNPFEPAALERVFTYSKGVPRTVNRLCASALSSEPQVVDAAAIDAAAFECGLTEPSSPYVATRVGAIERKWAELPHDPARGTRDARSSAIGRRRVRHGAAALTAALGLTSGTLYLANVHFGSDDAVTRALIRHEHPSPLSDQMLVSEALTNLPIKVGPLATVVAVVTAEKPASAADSELEPQLGSLSNDDSDLSRVTIMGAALDGGELLATKDTQPIAPLRPTRIESAATDSDRPSEPVVSHAVEANQAIDSDAQLGTEILVTEVLDGPSARMDLSSSAQEILPINLHDAEGPWDLNNDAAMQSAPDVSPDHAPPVGAQARAEEAPDATRSGSPPADFARSGALELQPTRAPTLLAPSRSTALDAERLVARGSSLFDIGDPASARLFFERAAMQGHAGAMTAAGETFDPLELRRRGIIGIRGEPERAIEWYRRSVETGDPVASERLARLNDWISRRANPH
jgi:type II secretory pathway predicted ATPase ExeA